MSTTCTLPAAAAAPASRVRLHRPWWQRALEAWRGAPDLPGAEQSWRGLTGISSATLRDIGAPEWVREARERADAQPLDLWRL